MSFKKFIKEITVKLAVLQLCFAITSLNNDKDTSGKESQDVECWTERHYKDCPKPET